MICSWTKGPAGTWVITGDEETLRAGRVMVQARGKAPEMKHVANVRVFGSKWIADPLKEPPPKRDSKVYPSFSEGTSEGAAKILKIRIPGGANETPNLGVGKVLETKDEILWVLGGTASFTPADHEEDFGQPGLPSGWWVHLGVRPATEEEAAPILQARAEEAKRLAETQAAKDLAEKTYHDQRSALLQGLFPVDNVGASAGDLLLLKHPHAHVAYYRASAYGHDVILETSSFGDLLGSTIWADRATAEAILDEKVREYSAAGVKGGWGPLTPEAAKAWLKRNEGCVGTAIYRRAAGIDPWS